MFKEGTILHFPNYIFNNGTSKAKFFIVIKEVEDSLIVATLPTSVDHVPAFAEKKHGCVNLDEANFNCYVFEEDKEITECGWAFSKQTFIYGHNIFFKSIPEIESTYPVEGVNYEVKGCLVQQEYHDLYDCLRSSRSIPRKYKKILT